MVPSSSFLAALLKRLAPLLVLAAALAAWHFSGLSRNFTLAAIQEQSANLKSIVLAHTIAGGTAFAALYAVSVALSLPAATLLTLLGGFLFGKYWGTLIVVSAATLGACALFLAARSAFGAPLRDKASGLYKTIAAGMEKNAAGYLLFLRLVPLFPFVLVNIAPALFSIRLRTYLWTTFFGIIPGTFVYVNLGEQLGTIKSLHDLVSPGILAALGLLGLLALVPAAFGAIKTRLQAGKKVADNG